MRRPARVLCRAFLLPIAALAVCALPVSAPASGSPAELLTSILGAGRAERSVHYTSTADYGAVANHKNVSVSLVGDAGLSVGIQRITFREDGKAGHVTVIANAAEAYIRGDAFTLANYMGFKPSAAAKYAGAWISIPDTSGGYATVAAGVTLLSTMDELKLSAPLTTLPGTTIDGRRVVGVKGRLRGSGRSPIVVSLYARATGRPLPVEEVTAHSRVALSRWNEPLGVAIPTHAVPVEVVERTP